MATGYLIVQARAAHNALPLSGVQIWIMDEHEKRVYHVTTDESGETEKLALETLDKSLSLNICKLKVLNGIQNICAGILLVQFLLQQPVDQQR